MTITSNIAHNLTEWMASSPSLDTIKKVSSRSGVGFGTVQRVKNGDGNPTVTNLFDIATAFGKRIEDILAEPGASDTAYAKGAATRLVAREKITPQELQNEIVEYLSSMDIDDMNVWIATITAAANKARRSKQAENVVKDREPDAHDPSRGNRHVA